MKSPDAVRPAVRRFLLEYNVRWPNLINGAGDQDYAGLYAVSEVPANVLIGREGTLIHLDLTRSNLERSPAPVHGWIPSKPGFQRHEVWQAPSTGPARLSVRWNRKVT